MTSTTQRGQSKRDSPFISIVLHRTTGVEYCPATPVHSSRRPEPRAIATQVASYQAMTDTFERLKTALADRYAIEHELGAGGMATVYLAEDLKHHRKVAVKVLRSELAAVLGADRFLREIEIAAKLQHPHILPLHDSGEADGFLYYVMPFVDGESLRSKLARERELPVQEAVRIIREVVDALINAHAIGVVHRDIKPDNVLLSGRHAVVTDFGIAKAVSEATGAQQMTTAGVALGTPAYMAPEQAVADPNVDHRADIYAVGVMAYEMLAGEPPFTGATPQAVLSAHVTEAPKAVTESRTTVSPELGAAIMKCLEKKPADRWQSAEELYVELEKLATPSGGTTPVAAVTAAPSRRRGVVVAAAVTAGVVLAVLGFIGLRGGGSATVIASGDRLAVIPFSPSSEDSALSRLGRDLVVLLTRNLDGVGDIEVVDHTTVLAKTGGSDRRYSLTEAAEIGRELGAATVVHGTLLRVADQVVLDVGLFETDGLEEIARASAQAPVNEPFVLTDETTWGLLRAIWKTGDAPTPSVAAITTRSWPALRAFLDGESAITRGEWVKAAGHYAEAIAADTTFWLAHLRYRIANSWSGGSGPPSEFVRSFAEIRDSLPTREQLQVDALLAPSPTEAFAIRDRLISRYPSYVPGLLDQADRLNHIGPYYGRDIRESRELYQRILDIDPDFLPAYEHFAYVGWITRDAGLMRMAIDSLRARDLQDVNFYGPAFNWIDLIAFWEGGAAAIEDPEIYRTPPSDLQVDSIIEFVERFATMGFGPWFRSILLPPDEWGLAASRRLAAGSDSAVAEVGHQRIGLMWAARGAWDSAAVAMEEYARWSRDPSAPVRAYRTAVYGVWVGALDVEVAREARDAVTSAVENLTDFFAAEVPFLDGVLAASQQDSSGIQRALRELEGLETIAAERFRGALSAFQMALRGNTAEAGRQLATQELQGSLNALRPIARLAAADWLMQAGSTREAERLLRWHEAVAANGEASAFDRTFEAVARLQRGRVAEAEGRLGDAAEFYSQFLQMYDMPTERHQHLREEAEAALARLAEERR